MTTGRERLQAALSPDGTAEIPAVICYEGIFYRDHWKRITSYPWWYAMDTDLDRQVLWHRDAMTSIGQDWFYLPTTARREDREHVRIVVRPDGVYRCDTRNHHEEKLEEPPVGGELIYVPAPGTLIETREELERLIRIPPDYEASLMQKDGRKDLADRLLAGAGVELCPIVHVSSPLWSCAMIWGFEGLMLMLVDHPALVKYACERFAVLCERRVAEAALLGAEVIWIEECYTDMVRVQDFREINVPYMTRMVQAIRAAGMKSVYYYCGNPARKLDLILSVGADAISLEEGKKDFEIDIEDIVEVVQGRCTVLGNLDATSFLPDCSEDELRVEVARQIAAGRRNNSRFIMSMGSPVTPTTSVQKVRLYCDLVHELGKG
ncbi:MAG: uroporphyrinogen decarboxylase family protein [Anaerolineae bacterium]